jgi:hypothetical protein
MKFWKQENAKNKKFYLIIFLAMISYNFVQAQNFSPIESSLGDRDPTQTPVFNRTPGTDLENDFSSKVCSGGVNIVKAGCSLVTGQLIRTVPSILIGMPLNKVNQCTSLFIEADNRNVKQQVRISSDDPCAMLGVIGAPEHLKREIALIYEEQKDEPIEQPYYSYSIASSIDVAKKFNNELMEKSFTPQYYANRTIERIPFVKTAFARQGDPQTDALANFMVISWEQIRNLSYLLISIFSIVLGISLMTSTVVTDQRFNITLEKAIPKVIIAVVLIQFSYFIGSVIFLLSEDRTFEAIVRYIVSQPLEQYITYQVIQNAINASPVMMTLVTVVGIVFSFTAAAPLVVPILLAIIFLLYRILVLMWYQLRATLGVVVITIFSPVLISLYVLPGSAGDTQLNRYASSLIAFLVQVFLYQAIWVLAIHFTAIGSVLFNGVAVNQVVTNGANFITAIFVPVIMALILMQADSVVGISNQLAHSITREHPWGGEGNR